MLDKVRVGNINDDIENLLRARFICDANGNYLKDALQINGENESAVKRNQTVIG